MSHGSDRERALLVAAVGQITAGLCLFCSARKAIVRWSETGRCWQIVVVHRPRCCVTRSVVYRVQADEFMHGLLQLHGLLIGDYGEDNLIRHKRLVIL